MVIKYPFMGNKITLFLKSFACLSLWEWEKGGIKRGRSVKKDTRPSWRSLEVFAPYFYMLWLLARPQNCTIACTPEPEIPINYSLHIVVKTSSGFFLVSVWQYAIVEALTQPTDVVCTYYPSPGAPFDKLRASPSCLRQKKEKGSQREKPSTTFANFVQCQDGTPSPLIVIVVRN